MKFYSTLYLTLLTIRTYAQVSDQYIHDAKGGSLINDTSFVFGLPYQVGNKYLFVQGAHSSYSNKGEISYDFKMKIGTPICAARAGKILSVRSTSNKGGLNDDYLNEGNYVIIEHSDGSMAYYWHLKQNGVLCKEGDQVNQGQIIAYSGNTGYTAFPHLHFQVVAAHGQEILVRFKTVKGVKYIKPGRLYKRDS